MTDNIKTCLQIPRKHREAFEREAEAMRWVHT